MIEDGQLFLYGGTFPLFQVLYLQPELLWDYIYHLVRECAVQSAFSSEFRHLLEV